jgi:D-alanyl-D-alanine carboxypeptidase (penicillin-binding protein 5/6)
MNKKALELGMEKTHYANSHGLMNADNKSCAFDLALLCEYAMRHETFREVVKTRVYECTIKS